MRKLVSKGSGRRRHARIFDKLLKHVQRTARSGREGAAGIVLCGDDSGRTSGTDASLALVAACPGPLGVRQFALKVLAPVHARIIALADACLQAMRTRYASEMDPGREGAFENLSGVSVPSAKMRSRMQADVRRLLETGSYNAATIPRSKIHGATGRQR